MSVYLQTPSLTLYQGDAVEVLRTLPEGAANCVVTSPPYFGLRDYGVDGQIGLEGSVEEYVQALVDVFEEARRVLTDDGTLWLNLGDSYVNAKGASGGVDRKQSARRGWKRPQDGQLPGLKRKDLIGIPWRVAFALQASGWYLRADIIWHKTNAMPESAKDRPTRGHEYVFLLTKSMRYLYDGDAIKEPAKWERWGSQAAGKYAGQGSKASMVQLRSREDIGERFDTSKRNARTVWSIPTRPYRGAHFAVFPPKLIEPCILAGCPAGGVVLDPFFGSGTTAEVALGHGRRALGIELNPRYCELAAERLAAAA